jgi:DNA mismatch endonuclease Vsr
LPPRKGSVGHKQSPESKEKIRKTLLGHTVSIETRLKIHNSKLGSKVHSEEWKKKMSERLKANTFGFTKGHAPWNTGLNKQIEPRLENQSGWKGKQFSEEHRHKLTISRARQVMPLMDTKPEKKVQAILNKLGIRFKPHVPVGFHQVDIMLNSNVAIEVEGCFWHQCEKCGFNDGYADRTAEEIREYDRLREEKIVAKGFAVYRIWEHDTKDLRWLEDILRTIAKMEKMIV